MDSNNGFKQMN